MNAYKVQHKTVSTWPVERHQHQWPCHFSCLMPFKNHIRRTVVTY